MFFIGAQICTFLKKKNDEKKKKTLFSVILGLADIFTGDNDKCF
jgi:hypothetical protein